MAERRRPSSRHFRRERHRRSRGFCLRTREHSSRAGRGRPLFEFRAAVFHHLSADGSPAAGLIQQSSPCRHGIRLRRGAALFQLFDADDLGYGDIVPIHPLARSLANLEGVIGQLYPATLLARLVSLEIEHRRQNKN
jgi:hypothetical protein